MHHDFKCCKKKHLGIFLNPCETSTTHFWKVGDWTAVMDDSKSDDQDAFELEVKIKFECVCRGIVENDYLGRHTSLGL